MKTAITTIFIILTFFSCQQKNQQKGVLDKGQIQDKGEFLFPDYVKTINQIDLPLKTTCEKELEPPLLPYADSLISKFGPENSRIYGKLADKKRFTAIIYLYPADIVLPIIQTTDKQGNKISTLNLFENCNEDELFKSTSWTSINKDLSIVINDSITTYKRDKEGEIINSSKRTKISHKNFYIDDEGQIIENNKNSL